MILTYYNYGFYQPQITSYLFKSNLHQRNDMIMKFGSILEHLGFSDFYLSDENILNKEMKMYMENDFKYLNLRFHGQRYLTEMLLNLLRDLKVLTEDQYKIHMDIFNANWKQSTDSFNREVNEAMSNIHRKYPNHSDEELKVKIFEELPIITHSLMNNILLEQRNTVTKLLKQKEDISKISKDESDNILKIFSEYIYKLESGLIEKEIETKKLLNNEINIINEAAKIDIVQGMMCDKELQYRKQLLFDQLRHHCPLLKDEDLDKLLKQYEQSEGKIKEKQNLILQQQKQELDERFKKLRFDAKKASVQNKSADYENLERRAEKSNLDRYGDKFIEDFSQIDIELTDDLIRLDRKIDTKELNEYQKIKEDNMEDILHDTDTLVNDTLQNLIGNINVDQSALNRILANYKQNSKNISDGCENDKMHQLGKLNVILQKRIEKRDEELSNGYKNQLDEEKKQYESHEKAMNERMNLNVDLKNKIAAEGQINNVILNQQLKESKERQQKLLELALCRLAKQRASTPVDSTELADPLERYDKISDEMSEERKKLLTLYRDVLITETKQLLDKHDRYMAGIIAKYQLSYNKTRWRHKNYKRAIDLLMAKMSETANSVDPGSAKQVVSQYQNDYDHLEQKKFEMKESQKEKLQSRLNEYKTRNSQKIQDELSEKYCEKFQKNEFSDETIKLVEDDLTDKIEMECEKHEKRVEQQLKDETDGLIALIENESEQSILEKKQENIAKLAQLIEMPLNELEMFLDQSDLQLDSVSKRQILQQLGQKFTCGRSRNSVYSKRGWLEGGNERPISGKYNSNNDTKLGPGYYQDTDLTQVDDGMGVENGGHRRKPKKKRKHRKNKDFEEENEFQMEIQQESDF